MTGPLKLIQDLSSHTFLNIAAIPSPSNTDIKMRPRGVFNKRPTQLVPIVDALAII